MIKLFKKKEKNETEKSRRSNAITDRALTNNRMIGIWGSFGSGKTTLSIKMAKYLSDLKFNTILVFDDILCPTIPTIGQNLKKQEEKSLGNILIGNIDQEIIKDNIVTLDNNKYLGLLGYKKGDNYKSYPEYISEIVEDFLLHLRHMADYVIIDCSSNIKDNIFTDTVLRHGDKVITLSTADLRGLSYFNSSLPLLIDDEYALNKHLNVVSNIQDFQDKETINNILKGKGIYLEHTGEISDQYIDKRIFEDLVTKESKEYNSNLKLIMEEMMYE